MTFAAVAPRLRASILLAATAIFTASTSIPARTQTTAPAKSATSATDPRVSSLISLLSKTRTPMQAALSPDSTTVAWSVRMPQGVQLHLTDVANPAEDKTIAPANGPSGCGSSEPVWSPNGDTLAFASTCTAEADKPSQEQIFVWSRKTGQSRQLTHLTGSVDSIAWSPDGKSLGFLYVENATRTAGALAAMKPWAGVIGEDGVEVQGVALVTVSDSRFVHVTPSTLHAYEFDWAPDSKRIAYVAANPPGENNWWVAQLYTQATTSNSTPQSILDTTKIPGSLHGLQIAVPKWSPDGSRIAFIGGIMSDQGSTGGDIYSIPSVGGAPTDIMPDKSISASWLQWSRPDAIRYVAHRGGGYIVSAFNTETLHTLPESSQAYQQSLWAGADVLSVAKSGAYAFVSSSYANPPEVFVSRGPRSGGLIQITHLNQDLKPAWGKSESIEWENDGFKIQGWLLYPTNYDPAKKYPLIVNVHGGPSAAVTPRWPGTGLGLVPYFSALDYFVFMPNPRGSYGQGEKFTQANIKDFGYGDLRDILAGMDVLEKRLPIDRNREGLTGWSYGGFMTMFGVTQTTRFRAAVAGAGISNWKSYYGENSIDQWMLPFFGASVYDDPAVYARSSAIEYIKNVKTPTLVVVGDRDGECPAPQSFEFWHALRAEGIKTQLVVYPDEGHHFVDAAHQRDVLQRALNWFETEMPGSSR
ncbi:MAG: WD40-like beta Propeller containing protein [Edaphobacter sp.]|nr:WD40-like beta Propeller containing protein [Edaphobacter sp.]